MIQLVKRTQHGFDGERRSVAVGVPGPVKYRVMVVDDDPEVVQILTVNLSHADLEVIAAGNGSQALVKAVRERPDMIVLDLTLPDIEGFEICRRLKDSAQTRHIPVIVVGTDRESERHAAAVLGRADHYITKPFDPNEVVSLVRAHFRRLERDRNRQALSGLPDRAQVQAEIAGLIGAGKPLAAILVDMDDLKAFNKAYGFAEGDRAIRLLADVLREVVQLAGNPDDLAGHFGGDNFAIVSTPERVRAMCQRIISGFDSRIRASYDSADLERGLAEPAGRSGGTEQSPLMTLSVAAVTNQKRSFHHHLEVTETASELIRQLRSLGGSNFCIDHCDGDGGNPSGEGDATAGDAHTGELKTLRRVLTWVSSFTEGLTAPVAAIQDSLDALVAGGPDGSSGVSEHVDVIRESVRQLLRTATDLTELTQGDWIAEHSALEEVDLAATFDWVRDQVRESADRRGVEIVVEGAGSGDRLVIEGRKLARSLLCLLRSEVGSARQGDVIRVDVRNGGDAAVDIVIGNRGHYAPQRELAVLLQGRLDGMMPAGLSQDLYLAKVLVHSIGGQLTVMSERTRGTTVTITVPRRWRSSVERVNALLSAAETSRKEARAYLESTWRCLLQSPEHAGAPVEENLKNLEYKIQELVVLCNRSLFMADDLSNRLESDQDRLLQRDSEQLATLEAMLAICGETAVQGGLEGLFDLGSAQRVARNALMIADRFRLSSSERQALHHAALLKDLGLVSCPEDMVEMGIVPSLEEAVPLRRRFSIMWQALSRLSFLSPALVLIWHHHERHDGTGYPFGVRGADIPLGARILAIADAFDALTSGSSAGGALVPEMAVQKLAAESGKRFDPETVGGFLHAWRKREFRVASTGPAGGMTQ